MFSNLLRLSKRLFDSLRTKELLEMLAHFPGEAG